MSKKVVIGVSISLVLVVVAIFAVAHEVRTCGPQEIGNRIVSRLSYRLDLTDEQEVELQRMTDEVIEETAEARAIRNEIRDEIIVQFRSDTFDAKKVNTMIQKRKKDFNQFSDVFVEKAAEFHALLTPEQREKFARGIEKHAERWHHGRD